MSVGSLQRLEDLVIDTDGRLLEDGGPYHVVRDEQLYVSDAPGESSGPGLDDRSSEEVTDDSSGGGQRGGGTFLYQFSLGRNRCLQDVPS